MTENKTLKALVVEDNEGDFFLVKEYLREVYTTINVSHEILLSDAIVNLSINNYDVILLDLTLPDSNGMHSIKEIIEAAKESPVIVLTGYADKNFAVDSLKLKVQDYLIKDEVNPAILFKSISYAIERKSIINQIETSEENYKYLFDQNPIPLFLYDPQSFEIIMVNESALKLYQYEREAFLTLSILDIRPESEKERIREFIQKTEFSSGILFTGEWKHLKSDGTLMEVEITTHDFIFEGRQCRLAVINDVTARNKARRDLEQSEKRFRALIENSSDGLCVIKTDGTVTDISPTGRRILGLTQYQQITNFNYETVHADDIDNVVNLFNEIIHQPEAVKTMEFRVHNSKKDYIWLEVTFNNQLAEPTINAIVLNFKDVSQRKLQEQERTALIGELVQNNRDLKQFSFITSHNLRAPLTNLMAIAELLDMNKIKDETTLELLKGFKISTIQLNETLNDLIKILIVKENTTQQVKNISFEDTFNTVKNTLESIITKSGAIITTNFSQAPQVLFKLAYMESVFNNLISNAIKYAHPGRVPEIQIYSTINNKTTQLIFQDNGSGFDMEKVKDKLFGLYQRFHNNSDKGIGLYLIHSQITALGGSIEAESTEHAGTTFTISFKNS